VQQVVLDQVPAPALVVGAEKGHIAVALQRRLLGGYTDDGHGAQRSLPDHLPSVPTVAEPNLAPGRICALRHGIAVGIEGCETISTTVKGFEVLTDAG